LFLFGKLVPGFGKSSLPEFVDGLRHATLPGDRGNFHYTVTSKTFILLLAHEQPRSLVSGSRIDLSEVLSRYNRNEFHHLYPQSFLRKSGINTEKQSPLANMCFINAVDNKILGAVAPSEYRERMSTFSINDVLRRALIPEEELFADDYPAFVDARAKLLVDAANARMSH
jgi:hypothetical protein